MLCTLAQDYDPKKVEFPALVSEKIDGIRCLAHITHEGVKLFSRDQKPIGSSEHIRKEIESWDLPPGTVLDGELWIPGVTFQKVSGLCRRKVSSDETKDIQYFVFDLADFPEIAMYEVEFRSRYNLLVGLLRGHVRNSSQIQVLRHRDVFSHQEILDATDLAVSQGFEGLIVRTGLVKYKGDARRVGIDGYQTPDYGYSERTWGIQKVKQFQDEEFLIIDIYEEKDLQGQLKGRAAGFILSDIVNNVVFQASGLTAELKERVWQKPEDYIGQTATIKFFGRSTGKIPRHPTFKCFTGEK